MSDYSDLNSFLSENSQGQYSDLSNFLSENQSKEPQPPQTGPVADALYSGIKPLSNILSAFGHGFHDGWGAIPYTLSDPTKDALKKADLYKGWEEQHQENSKAFGEAFIRPELNTLYQLETLPFRPITAIVQGIGEGGVQLGTELVNKAKSDTERLAGDRPTEVSHTLSAIEQGIYNLPGEAGEAAQAFFSGQWVPETLMTLLKEKSQGKLGEGEQGYFNTVKPSEANLQSRASAATEIGAKLPDLEPPLTDIPTLARKINPEVYEKHDNLINQAKTLEDRIKGITQAKESDEVILKGQEELNSLIDKLSDTGELSETEEARYQELNQQLNTRTLNYTEELFKLRQEQAKVQSDFHDLKPYIASAEEHAKSLIPDILEQHQQDWFKYADKVYNEGEGKEESAELPRNPANGPQPEEPKPLDLNNPEVQKVIQEVSKTIPVHSDEFMDEVKKQLSDQTGPRSALTLQDEHDQQIQGLFTEAAKAVSDSTSKQETVEGTKTSGLAKGIEARAVAQGLTESFGTLPEYKTVSIKDQATKALGLIQADPEKAIEMALGNTKPPEGVLATAVFKAVEKNAMMNGDVDLLRRLATESKVLQSVTEFAQSLNMLRDPNSPAQIMRDIQTAREKAIKNIEETRGAEIDNIKRFWKTYSEQDWTDFVNSIQCDY